MAHGPGAAAAAAAAAALLLLLLRLPLPRPGCRAARPGGVLLLEEFALTESVQAAAWPGWDRWASQARRRRFRAWWARAFPGRPEFIGSPAYIPPARAGSARATGLVVPPAAWPPELARLARDLRAHAPAIHREAEGLARARVRDAEPGLANASWTQHIVREGDQYRTDHAYAAIRQALDPHETYLARYPRPRHFLVCVSVLEPGAVSVLHAGHTNARWRVHLTLTPTEEGCELAGALTSHGNVWHEGEVVVLDDAHLHAVRNRGPRARMILLVDVPRLDLPPRLMRRAAALEARLLRRQEGPATAAP